MIIKRYNFPYIFGTEGQGNHKISRVYISDYKTNYKLLKGLKKHNSLTTSDYPLIFGSSRSEKNREQLIELWRSGFKIGILRNGSRSYKVANLSETEIQEDDIKINTVLKRKTHPYTLFFLDILKKYKNLSEKEFAEKVFEKGESGAISKSAIDQVHPTLRDFSVWNYSQKNGGSKLTELGRKILEENNEKITFICYRKDLNQDKVKIRLLWCILREIESDKNIPTYPNLDGHNIPFKINLEHLKKRYHGRGLGNIPKVNNDQIENFLKEIGINHKLSNNDLIIFEKIFFSIVPALYVTCGLSELDNIDSHFNKIDSNNIKLNEEKNLNIESNYLVISNELKDIDGVKIITEEDWLSNYKFFLNSKNPKAIFIGKNWNQSILEATSGYLQSYVKSGGFLIINGHQSGRVGTNRQFFNWLPQDFEALNYISSSRKWSFDKERIEKLPIYCDEFMPNKPYNEFLGHFSASYGEGCFIFEGIEFNEKIILKIINDYKIDKKEKIVISEVTKKYYRIAQLHRDEKILKEENTYPIIGKEILMENLGFILSKSFSYCWEGNGTIKPYVDLFTIYPRITLWEVDSLKGKTKSSFGGISGESVSIDQTHAVKTPQYGIIAEKNLNNLYIILNTICEKMGNEFNLDDKNHKILLEIVDSEKQNIKNKPDKFQIDEIFTTHLNEYLKFKKVLNIDKFLEKLKDPLTSLIGVSYGFYEGIKESAREISKDNNYSLWTYRDLFEFLVRTDNFDLNKKKKALINVLEKQDGPVYNHISKIKPNEESSF